jgi:cytidine deaminase
MKNEEIHIQYSSYQLNEIDTQTKELLEHAKAAMKNAYSPYSRFQVGAALRLENGEIITGNNQENAVYPVGLCAERVALFYANANYPNIAVTDLLIIAESGDNGITEIPVSPCGSCRQVMHETETRFNHNIRLILVGKTEVRIFERSSDLLPLVFGDKYLPE